MGVSPTASRDTTREMVALIVQPFLNICSSVAQAIREKTSTLPRGGGVARERSATPYRHRKHPLLMYS